MNVLFQFGLILGICLAGEAVSMVLPFPFPGGVTSMMILLVLMLTGIIKHRHVDKTADFMLSNLVLFFIPAFVGIIQYLDVVRDNLKELIIICVISTFLTFAAATYAIRLVLRLQNRHKPTKAANRSVEK